MTDLTVIDYRANGHLDSAIYDGSSRDGQPGYLILVRRYSEFVVARYYAGDDQWCSGRYFRTYQDAMSCLLKSAEKQWRIEPGQQTEI